MFNLRKRNSVTGDSKTRTRFNWRPGIGGKLLLAFAAVSGLIVAAGGTAFFTYHGISNDLAQIEQTNLPEINEALTMARRASDMATISAKLTGVRNREDLKNIKRHLPEKSQALALSIKALIKAGVDKKIIGPLQDAADNLSASANALFDTVDLQLDNTDERVRMVSDAIAAHHQLAEAITPLAEAAAARIATDTQTISGEDFAFIQALTQIRADSNILLALLNEASMKADAKAFKPLNARIAEVTKHLKQSAASLNKTGKATEIPTRLDALLAFANEKNGIADCRGRELSIMSDNWDLVGVNTEMATALASQVEQTAEQARQAAIAAVSGSSANIADGKAVLTGLMIAGIVCVVLAWFFVRAYVVARIQRLNMAVLALADGDLTVTVPRDGRDELGSRPIKK